MSDSLSILHSFGWILNLLEIALSKIYNILCVYLAGIISQEAWDNVKHDKSNVKILYLGSIALH